MTAIALSFVAGTLSVLSPCVLPVLPIVIASALQQHRFGPVALSGGFALSSTAAGLFFASLGFAVGIDRDVTRILTAALMALAGLVLLVPPLQTGFARLVEPVASGAGALTARLPAGLVGQAALGVLLGAVWTPCTGPTLGAAITLASRSEDLARAAAIMFVFGIGAMVPVLAIAYGSRRALGGGGSLTRIAAIGKPAMGVFLVAIGVLAMTGADKRVETWLVDHLPEWLIALTTSV